ncbi:MAG: hypothetical protein Q9219_003246 [cf. Caloplaca sp. 3 TL-2023]
MAFSHDSSSSFGPTQSSNVEFKVEIVPDPNTPSLDKEEVYRTSINVMYDVTATLLDYPWGDRAWASVNGNVAIYLTPKDFGGKESSHMYTQFLIWGLNHLILSMNLSNRYSRTIATMKWNGHEIGSLYIANKEDRSLPPAIIPQNQTDTLEQLILQQQQQQQQKQQPHIPVSADTETVEITIDYSGNAPIDRYLIYLTVLKALGEAAEHGLNRRAEKLLTMGLRRVQWQLIGGTGAFTGPFKAAHSRIAVMKTVAAMIQDQRFQRTHVWVRVDGRNTAAGGLSQGVLSAVE